MNATRWFSIAISLTVLVAFGCEGQGGSAISVEPAVAAQLVSEDAASAGGRAADFDITSLRIVDLGKGDAPQLARTGSGGALVLTGGGRDAHRGTDDGTFACIETDAPNFTLVARLAKFPRGEIDSKCGIGVRAGLERTAKAVNLRYDSHEWFRCVQWFMRWHVAPDNHDGAAAACRQGELRDWDAPDGVWMKIVRRYPFVYTYVSRDAQTWQDAGGDYLKVLLSQKCFAGVMVTARGDGKQQVTAQFDNISFKVDPVDELTQTQDVFREHNPPMPVWRMHLARVKSQEKNKPADFSAFLLMPKDMDPGEIRAILWSAGCKEVNVGGKALRFVNGSQPGEQRLRRPAVMDAWEGTLDIDNLRPFYHMLSHYGIVRVGGAFKPDEYAAAIARLAEVTGIKHLPNVPFMVTGASFAGGFSAAGAANYPELTIASAPVIIGMAGSDTNDAKVLATPHLHVFGSRDGAHLKDVMSVAPSLRQRGALWAQAPMWEVYHRQYKADTIIYPYFIEMMRLRLPDNANYFKPVALRPLAADKGWVGLLDTWETTHPQVMPLGEYKGESHALSWLPNERLARLWQAFASNRPGTIIHFPMSEGSSTFDGPTPFNWHDSIMKANEPFELVASGPLGDGLEVKYFDGERELKVLKRHNDNPYRVTLQPLPAGLHSIYAVTTVDGKTEISHPVTILFAD